MPFICGACGAGRDLVQLPVRDGSLHCPECGSERPFVRPPLLVVTGTSGSGKSTICARLAGRIPDAVLLDADVFAREMVSVTGDDNDYPAFWRSMARLAHEVSQNGLAMVFFSVMLPQQLLANTDVLDYFASVGVLCLRCDEDALRDRHTRRLGSAADPATVEATVARWRGFDAQLGDAVRSIDGVDAIDGARGLDEVERDVREWILARLSGEQRDPEARMVP